MTEGTSLSLHQQASSLVASEAGAITKASEARSEMEAAVVMARNYPRDEARAAHKMHMSAWRVSFAEEALYSFPRGGTQVEGPSVRLAREMARCWGNLRHSIQVVSIDEDFVHVRGRAWDMETNTLAENETKFKRLQQRKGRGGVTQWVEPDERDMRELVSRHGAVCVRNAILQLMPYDVVEDMLNACKETTTKAATSGLAEEEGRVANLRSLEAWFKQHGVTKAMLEQRLGHDLAGLTAAEYTELKRIGFTLRDGAATPGDYFEAARATQSQGDAAKGLEGALGQAQDPDRDAKVAAAKRKLDKARADAAAAEATTPDAPATTDDSADVRVIDGRWIWDLPKLDALDAVLAAIDHEDPIIDMMGRDSRVTAGRLYEKHLKERFDIDVSDDSPLETEA